MIELSNESTRAADLQQWQHLSPGSSSRIPGLRITFCLMCSLLALTRAVAYSQDEADARKCGSLEYEYKIKCCVSILESDPCDRDAFLMLTWSMAEEGQWVELNEVLDKLSASSPDVPHLHKMRAYVLAEHLGDIEQADRIREYAEGLDDCLLTEEDELREPLAPTPENAERILNRANLRYWKFQDYEGAAQDYETYLSLVPGAKSPSVFHNLAGARRQLGDLPGAIDALSQEMVRFPERRPEVLRARARLFRELGDSESAGADLAVIQVSEDERNSMRIRKLTERIASNPRDYWSVCYLAEIRIEMGDFSGAIRDASRAIALNPTLQEAYEIRARAKAEMGDLEGARADRLQAVECRRKR